MLVVELQVDVLRLGIQPGVDARERGRELVVGVMNVFGHFGQAFDNVVSFIKGNPTNIVNPGALQVRR